VYEEDSWLMAEMPNGTEENTTATLSKEQISAFELVELEPG
jgi:hypothetical protein